MGPTADLRSEFLLAERCRWARRRWSRSEKNYRSTTTRRPRASENGPGETAERRPHCVRRFGLRDGGVASGYLYEKYK